MSSSDRKSMPLLILGLVVLAIVVYWLYTSRKVDGPPAPPVRVDISINLERPGKCKFDYSPNPVTLHKVATDKRPNAASWHWVGDTRGYVSLWFVLKANDLGNCLPVTDLDEGLRGFEIPLEGTDAKQVMNTAECKPGEYPYDLVARRDDDSSIACDPAVIIEP